MRIAFCKFAGMGNGGIEKYLQTMAIIYKKAGHVVDYFYTNDAPLVHTSWIHPPNNAERIELLTNEGINLIPIHVDHRNHNEWVGSDFFDKFNESNYDFLVTGGNGESEYPYNRLKSIKIIHTVHGTHPFNQDNIHRSVLLCDWQARQWTSRGGDPSKLSIIPSVVYIPKEHTKTFRERHGIPEDAFVFGLHQRNESGISSTVALDAFSRIDDPKVYFAILGGSDVHRQFSNIHGVRNVIFAEYTSNVNDIHDFLDALDVYAHCRSDGEVCSACIVEAMSHSLPVISIPGQNMGHADQLNGCGLIARSTDEYYEEMMNLMGPTKYYQERRQQIKKKYDGNYDFKVVEQSMLKLLN
jgi:hypothetical protein